MNVPRNDTGRYFGSQDISGDMQSMAIRGRLLSGQQPAPDELHPPASSHASHHDASFTNVPSSHYHPFESHLLLSQAVALGLDSSLFLGAAVCLTLVGWRSLFPARSVQLDVHG